MPAVVSALIAAANDAGGKDNVTVVYVEGERFARPCPPPTPPIATVAGRRCRRLAAATSSRGRDRLLVLGLIGSCRAAVGAWVAVGGSPTPAGSSTQGSDRPAGRIDRGAVDGRGRGAVVVVEPGEYREQIVLRDQIRVVSRVPRGVTLRLPVAASEGDAAVVRNGTVRGRDRRDSESSATRRRRSAPGFSCRTPRSRSSMWRSPGRPRWRSISRGRVKPRSSAARFATIPVRRWRSGPVRRPGLRTTPSSETACRSAPPGRSSSSRARIRCCNGIVFHGISPEMFAGWMPRCFAA